MKILVTGGAGFIGTEVCRLLVSQPSIEVLNIDCLSYAANLDGIKGLSVNGRYTFETGDIRDGSKITELLEMFSVLGFASLFSDVEIET